MSLSEAFADLRLALCPLLFAYSARPFALICALQLG
jgi:hypothetical protein